MIKNTLTRIARWVERLVGYQPKFKAIICDELPDVCKTNRLYLVGERKTYWMAAMVCPCGCGDLIQLALDPSGRPRWDFTLDDKNQITLTPSVHRKIRCRSHFILRKGKVLWCE